MRTFDFETQQPRKKGSRPVFLVIGVGIALIFGFTFASNISINSSAPVEFGKGIAVETACDHSIKVTLISKFVNVEGSGSFKLSEIKISDINTESCLDKAFKLRIFGISGRLNFFGDIDTLIFQSKNPELSYIINNPDRDASTILRFTLESIQGFSGAGEVHFNPANGHYYTYSQDALSWDQAFNLITGSNISGVNGNPGTPQGTINYNRTLSSCHFQFAGMCGYFVTITSGEENNFLNTQIQGDTWLGATNRGNPRPQGPWYWADDIAPEYAGTATSISYSNWSGGEPNNSGENESAMEMYLGRSTWNDLNEAGSGPLRYIVEYGGSNIDNPTVDLAHTLFITS